MLIRVSKEEFDAILAALRFLQIGLSDEDIVPGNPQDDIADLLTRGGTHDGLNEKQIDDLCVELNTGVRDG